MTRYAALCIAIGIALPASACRPFRLETPDSLIELDEPDRSAYDYRASSADGVVVSGRAIPNKQRGTLGFWTEAIRNKLRIGRAYELLEEQDVRTAAGMTGKQLRFGIEESGHQYRYWATIFVTTEGMRPRVYVLEAGGQADVFEQRRADVERLISSFEPR